PETPPSDDERRSWLLAAERIALGVVPLAHVDAFVDVARYRVGFSCESDVDLAKAYVRAIRRENVEARQVAAVSGRPADEIILPCRPDASDAEITHVVLAALKASHALEFDVIVDLASDND